MIESLIDLDKSLALIINGAHATWLDEVMVLISEKLTWIPLYLAILFGIGKNFSWKVALVFILACVANLGLTDPVSVFFKESFLRLRPCHQPELKSLLHLVDGCGGKFSFVSSHASNTMGLAVLVSLIFKRNWVTSSMLVFAFLNGYSRIYLGKHFPLDILGGFILGAICALIIYKLATYIIQRFNLAE